MNETLLRDPNRRKVSSELMHAETVARLGNVWFKLLVAEKSPEHNHVEDV